MSQAMVMGTVLTPDQMRDLLAMLLRGAAGGERGHWLDAIGPVEKLPTHLNVRSNWTVHPKGKAAELAAIRQAVEIVRGEHLYVAV